MNVTVAAVVALLLVTLGGNPSAASVIIGAPDPTPSALARGEFIWHPEVSPFGPVVIVVSLDEQRAYVYRNGVAIGASTISSGRKGHETPPGVFTILQKEVEHHSNKYDNAPMPFMERLTWDGMAMHGGTVPGYPASHGCIRLPTPFARKLFEVTTRGVAVIIANSKTAPAALVHPAMLAPIAAAEQAIEFDAQTPGFTWNDPPVTSAPVSILVSTTDHVAFVFRNGMMIGSARVDSTGRGTIGGSMLYVLAEGFDYVPSLLDPARPKHLWTAYPLPTRADPAPRDIVGSLQVPQEFARRVYDVLTPGTTVLVTDLPAIRHWIDNKPVRVLESVPDRPQPP